MGEQCRENVLILYTTLYAAVVADREPSGESSSSAVSLALAIVVTSAYYVRGYG